MLLLYILFDHCFHILCRYFMVLTIKYYPLLLISLQTFSYSQYIFHFMKYYNILLSRTVTSFNH